MIINFLIIIQGKMKVIHLGPFNGNLGDVFSYVSFQRAFSEKIDEKVEFTNVNIREFYKNTLNRKFDKEFTEVINKYDLFVIGGGQYFDVRWEDSETGTTLDMGKEFVESIKIPVLINAIGYTEIEKNNEEIFHKFKSFLNEVVNRENWMITVRNDGSYERIVARYGKKMAKKIRKVPDNGFFFTRTAKQHKFDEDKMTIGLSIGNDSFSDDANVDISNFNAQMSMLAKKLIDEYKCRLIFFVHTPQDIKVVYEIIRHLNDMDVRNSVVVSPYDTQGKNSAELLVEYYNACDMCIAMRFHSNIISIQNRIPTIGFSVNHLVSNKRIDELYRELELEDYLFRCDSKDEDIAEKVLMKISEVFSTKELCVASINKAMERMKTEQEKFFENIKLYV